MIGRGDLKKTERKKVKSRHDETFPTDIFDDISVWLVQRSTNSWHISTEWKEPLGHGRTSDDKPRGTRPSSGCCYSFPTEETATEL